jgi:hypothetical protein
LYYGHNVDADVNKPFNSICGIDALYNNTVGAYNTATGDGALLNNELLPIALTFAHVLLSALS